MLDASTINSIIPKIMLTLTSSRDRERKGIAQ